MPSTYKSSSGWSRLAPVLTLLAASASSAVAKYTCDTSLGKYYPYCVNVPDNVSDGDKLPTILFLSGSGARGPASNVKSLSGYDGFGKLINEYNSGNTGDAQTMAAEKFITIIPISLQYDGDQEVRHWWPEYLDKVLEKVSSEYPVDEDQIHCSGYSMGSRGCWRYATNRPGVLASAAPSAGASESAGDGTLSQQYAEPTFPLLDQITSLPIRQFDGSYDSTAGTESPKKTQSKLVSLGSTVAALHQLDSDHSGLSTKPFTTDLMEWMLQQKRSGSSSSSSSDDDETTSSSSSSSSAAATSTKKVKGSSTATASSSSAASTSTSSSSSSGSGSSGKKKCKAGSSKKAKRSEAVENQRRDGGLTLAKMLASKNVNQKQKRGLTLNAIVADRQNSSNTNARRHLSAGNVGRAHPGHQARMMGRRLITK